METCLNEINTEPEMIRVKSTIGPDKVFTRGQYEEYQRGLDDFGRKYKEWNDAQAKDPTKNRKLIQLLYNDYNREIERVVFGDKKNLIQEFNQFKITREAYNKASLISKRVLEITDVNEIYMHLLNYKEKGKNKDYAIRDVYILRDQEITPVHCGNAGVQGAMDSLKEIRNENKYVFAWGHSHGNLGVFHSNEDFQNIENLVTLNGTKLDITPKPFSCSDTSFTFKFFPSMVFDTLGNKPSCHIGIKYPHFEMDNMTWRFHMNKDPELKIINENNGITMDSEMIEDQIMERTRYNGKEVRERKYREERDRRKELKPVTLAPERHTIPDACPEKPKAPVQSITVPAVTREKEFDEGYLREYVGMLKEDARARREHGKRITVLEEEAKQRKITITSLEANVKKYEKQIEELGKKNEENEKKYNEFIQKYETEKREQKESNEKMKREIIETITKTLKKSLEDLLDS